MGTMSREVGAPTTKVKVTTSSLSSGLEHNKIPVRDIETAEMVNCVLRVKNILVHDKGCALGRLRFPEPDLTYGAVLPEDPIHLIARDVEGQVPHVKHAVHLGRQPDVPTAGCGRRHADLKPSR
eukprot:CAMPEP_0197501488 /NCGR_PEP_ID=MMETSP1312-20131121/722_1 /TAXON_ID=464262 /ORGANISM="Genus nov. species nov., Strain RCC2335" /LENGTH=123 /DNA_ID=CAMNT_0043047421 /DNA_START=63 /DNA_END=431 /DNA_ORIENTATION=+